MCGICGFVNKRRREFTKESLKAMLSVIQHRGPDAEGIYVWKNVGIGHRRLSIIDLSEDGNQPMSYLERYVMTYNGEVYNYLELKRVLEKKGYSFKTKTDTEVILAAYDCWKEDCLKYFNGMWAFAILDKKRNRIFMARDRYGIKPFYYYKDNSNLLFASEIKQILKVKPELAVANTGRLQEFLMYGITESGEKTFYDQIYSLKPGHQIVYDIYNESFEITRWYDYNHNIRKKSYTKTVTEFRKLFEDAVNLRKRADVRIGACLSGGIDSSAIVCTYMKDEKAELSAISSCYKGVKEKRYDEREYIDAVVKKTGVDSVKVYLTFEEGYSNLEKIIWHMDEPFSSFSILAQWKVFKEAKRKGLTVMMDGQGADEQLCGYTSFIFPALIDDVNHLRLINYLNTVRFLRKRACLEKINYRALSLKAVLYSKWLGRIKKLYEAGKTKGTVSGNELFKFECKISEKHNFMDIFRYSKHMMEQNLLSLLHYEDRNSMSFSIESRVPFLDYRLVNLNMSLPSCYKIRNGFTKALLRDAMKGLLPEKIRKRVSKLGFAAPEDVWINENDSLIFSELSQACDELPSLVDKGKVLEWHRKCVETNKKDEFVFRIICLAKWKKVYNVRI